MRARIRSSNLDPINKMTQLAKIKAGRYAIDDPRAMAEDLRAAGWIGYLSDKRADEQLRWRRAEDFMMDAWVAWRFGVQAGEARREEPKQGIDLGGLADDAPSIEEVIIANDLLEKLRTAVQAMKLPKTGAVLQALIHEEETRIPPATRKRFKIKNSDELFFRRHKIQATLRELFGEEL